MGIWKEIKKSINSDLGTPLNTLINSVKTSVDTTNSNVSNVKDNMSAINTNTATNNTANSSGTLSQKLSWLINTWTSAKAGFLDATVSSRESEANAVTRYNNLYNRMAITQPSLSGVGANAYVGSTTTGNGTVCIAKFIAPVSGLYKLTATSEHSATKGLFFIARKTVVPSTNDTFMGEYGMYNLSTVNASFQWGIKGDGSSPSYTYQLVIDMADVIGVHKTQTSENYFYCRAGEPICIGVVYNTNSSPFTSVVVSYEPR